MIRFQAELDGALLEIVAEGEIAEHSQKKVWWRRGVADIVEIIVLAAGAHAFLRRHGAVVGAAFKSGEDVLELHHAGIGEHQCRIVARDQRTGRHDLVPVLAEIVEKCRPDVVDATHANAFVNARADMRGKETGPFSVRSAHCPETQWDVANATTSPNAKPPATGVP